jgi:hypothetical protein
MRRRITKAFVAAAAAGATVTTLALAASPAGAAAAGKYFSPSGSKLLATDANCVLSTPPAPGDDCGMSGYQATGRDFRFAAALIDVPDHVGHVIGASADPSLYVALDDSTNSNYRFARVGIAPCTAGLTTSYIEPGVTLGSLTPPVTCPPSGWVLVSAVEEPVSGPTVDVSAIPAAFMGDGIAVSVYQNGSSVQTVATLPDGSVIQHVLGAANLAYTSAMAVADYTTTVESPGSATPLPAVPTSKVRDSQFFQGRFTTVSGAKGTFSGPWTLEALEATSNGSVPPSGTLIGQPSYLWNDGNGLNGQGSDAFGVWRFPF